MNSGGARKKDREIYRLYISGVVRYMSDYYICGNSYECVRQLRVDLGLMPSRRIRPVLHFGTTSYW